MKVYTDNYYQTIAASLFFLYKINDDKAMKILNIQTKLKINHNSDSMPKTAMPVGATTSSDVSPVTIWSSHDRPAYMLERLICCAHDLAFEH